MSDTERAQLKRNEPFESCTRKYLYYTEEQALAGVRYIQAKPGFTVKPGEDLRPFRCKWCGFYHIGNA